MEILNNTILKHIFDNIKCIFVKRSDNIRYLPLIILSCYGNIIVIWYTKTNAMYKYKINYKLEIIKNMSE